MLWADGAAVMEGGSQGGQAALNLVEFPKASKLPLGPESFLQGRSPNSW